jgi:hypothetical protein
MKEKKRERIQIGYLSFMLKFTSNSLNILTILKLANNSKSELTRGLLTN